MTLKGARQLHARLDAVRDAPQAVGRAWAEETARLARVRVAVASGATRRSIAVQRASRTGATVVASEAAQFLEGGVRRHPITAGAGVLRFGKGGQPLYRKRVSHPGMRKRPFMAPSSREAFRRKSPGKAVAAAWNKAA